MRNLTRSLLLASGLALTGAAVATPALADTFRFGINVGPPAYYYGPPAPYYYSPYYGPRPYYYW